MEKKDLLHHCRYYKGEEGNPYKGLESWFWNMEHVYVRTLLEQPDTNFDEQFEGEYYNLFIGRNTYSNIAPHGLCVVIYTAFAKHYTPYCNEDFEKLMSAYQSGDMSCFPDYEYFQNY